MHFVPGANENVKEKGGGVLLIAEMAQGSPPAGGGRGSQMVRFAIFAPKTTGFIR